MAKKAIVPDEVWQNLIDNRLAENVDTDPKSPARYFVNNLFQRCLCHLVGRSDLTAVMLKATAAGELKVATSGTGFEHNDTIAKFAVADAYAEKSFAQVVSRVDITVWTFGVIIKRIFADGGAYEDEIELVANTLYSFDCSTYKISVKNATPGSNASCQLVGWY